MADTLQSILNELAAHIRSVSKVTKETASNWRSHRDSPGLMKMASIYDGWADAIEAAASLNPKPSKRIEP